MRFHEYFTQPELDILRQRAERLAVNTNDSQRVERSALRVMIGREQYALSMTAVASVYVGLSIVAVPCTPAHILGVANIRGHVMPVLRLSHLLNAACERIEKHVIVARSKDYIIGMAVSDVGDILNYADDDVMPMVTASHAWITGILANGTTLLDLEILLNDPLLTALETSQA